jgi:ATPase family associated with various cellular activities (AAA)
VSAAWQDYVRLVGRVRVQERRATWRGRGVASIHAEVDDVLGGAPDATPLPEVEQAWDAVHQDERWRRVAGCFALDRPEQELLALLAAAHADPRIGRVLGYLDDDVHPAPVTVAAAARFFGWAPGTRPGPAGPLVGWSLAQPDETFAHPWQPGTPWATDPDVVALLLGSPGWSAFWPGLEHVREPARACLHGALADEIAATARTLPGAVEVELMGRPGSGRRTLLAAVCARLDRDALLITHPRLGVRALRTARLLDAVPVWIADGLETPAVFDDRPGALTLVASTEPAVPPSHVRLSYTVPDPPRAVRRALWEQWTDAPVPTAVDAWALTPAEIATAAEAAPAGPQTAAAVLRRRLGTVSASLMTPLACPYDHDDLVLAPAVRRQLDTLEAHVRLSGAVLDDLGLRRLSPTSRGTTALFAGPSGTGKTMAAQVLARSLELDLHRVDLAQVVNKYIGETEKRLAQVFDECERSRVMVLFDEADALFGQRTKVRDAHDRFANIEIDYLLTRMESFDGVAILATNRKGDLDTGFLRRLRLIIEFLMPGPAERRRLWERSLPETTPSGEPLSHDIDHAALAAELTLTGAEIKAVVLAAAFAARAGGERIGPEHVLAAARAEVAKRGGVLREPRPSSNHNGRPVIAGAR